MKAASGAAHRPVRGAARLLRGVLSAVAAVGFAAAAHTAAGHHAPHAVVILLALAVSIPLCAALSGVRLSRLRLAAAVLSSQAVLHGLFELFPAQQALRYGQIPADAAHAHHGQPVLTALSPGAEAHVHAGLASGPDAGMASAHLGAALLTYVMLRRGEVLLCALAELITLAPVLTLLSGIGPLTDDRSARRAPAASAAPRSDVWNGSGPRTLRGPPAFDLAC